MSLPSVLPGEPLIVPEADVMPLHVKVIVGICITVVAMLFLLIIYAIMKNRNLLYCDVLNRHKQLKAAVLGTGSEKAGGRDLMQNVGRAMGGNAQGKAPLLQQIVIQGKACAATCASPQDNLLNSSPSYV